MYIGMKYVFMYSKETILYPEFLSLTSFYQSLSISKLNNGSLLLIIALLS